MMPHQPYWDDSHRKERTEEQFKRASWALRTAVDLLNKEGHGAASWFQDVVRDIELKVDEIRRGWQRG